MLTGTPDLPTKRATRRPRRDFGKIRELPSGRFQASYVGPDLARHNALDTFDTRGDAGSWLDRERRLIADDEWVPPKLRRKRAEITGVTLNDYAAKAIRRRMSKGQPLKPRTVALYDNLLERLILPELGEWPMRHITDEVVADWYARLPDAPTQRAHCYALLRSLFEQAINERRLPAKAVNPCSIKGAGVTRRKRRIEPVTIKELGDLAAATSERVRPMILLAGWAGMRYGEVAELRRGDLDLEIGVIHVRRAVVRVRGENVVGDPKSDASDRDIWLPPHIVPMLQEHLDKFVGPRKRDLLFPSQPNGDKQLMHASFYRRFFIPARTKAELPELRYHDLRHTAAVLAAQTGANLAELMARLGHSTPAAAMRYQHAARGRDAEIAAALSKLAGDRP